MMNKKSLAMGIALLAGTTAASAEGLGVSVNTGLVGLGIGTGADITYSVHPMVNIRGGFMTGKKSVDATIEANEFSITSKANTLGVYVDWLVLQGDFRVTAGYVDNSGSLNLSAPSGATIDFSGNSYTVTSFSGDIKFKASPYVGIGWGNAARKDKKFGFNMDVGVLLDSKPSIDITATGAGITQTDIDNLENEITGDNKIKALPVITVGMTYHF